MSPKVSTNSLLCVTDQSNFMAPSWVVAVLSTPQLSQQQRFKFHIYLKKME